jgi:tRNA1(Val) A37 N6-methylase TrmN6
VSNPPFFKLDRGHPSPDPVRRVARQEVSLTARDLLEAAAGLLTHDGLGVFLYPIQRGFEVAATARSLGLHVRRRAVRSFEHSPPFLAIVEVAHRAFEEAAARERPLTLYEAPHVHREWLQTWVDLIRRNDTDGG